MARKLYECLEVVIFSIDGVSSNELVVGGKYHLDEARAEELVQDGVLVEIPDPDVEKK